MSTDPLPAPIPAADPAVADPPPLEPSRPQDFECCGNGCEPCVFDLHAQAQERWRQEMKAWRRRQADAVRPLPAAVADAREPGLPALCRSAEPRANPQPAPSDP